MICYSHIVGKIIVTVFLDSNFYMQWFQAHLLKLHCKALTTVSANEPSVDVLKDLNQKQIGKREKSSFCNNIIFQILIELKLSAQRCLAQGRSDVMICYSHFIGKIMVNVLLDSNVHMYQFQAPSLKWHCKASTMVSVSEPSSWCPQGLWSKAIWKARKVLFIIISYFKYWLNLNCTLKDA